MIRSLLGGSDKGQVKISIHLESQEAVRAGTSLKGRVVCEVIAKEIIQGESIHLAITGKERVSRTSGKRISAARSLCQMKTELNEFLGRRLEPGRLYTFPFSVKLPRALPSSCSFKTGKEDLSLKVDYKIRASGYLSTNEKYFDVASAPMPDERIPCIQKPVTQTVKSMNSVDRGNMTLAARILDTHIGRGDTIKLSLAFRNNSSTEIQRIEIKVVEVVAGDIKAPQYGNFGKDHIHKQNLYVKKSAKVQGPKGRFESLCKGSAEVRGQSIKEDVQLRSIYRELFDNEFTVEFSCPETARDSYSGRLLYVQHYVQIKLMTNAVTDNPSVTIPLKIGNPPTRRSKQLRARSPASNNSRSRPRSPNRSRNSSHERPMSSLVPLSSLEALAPPEPLAIQVPEDRIDSHWTHSASTLPPSNPRETQSPSRRSEPEPPPARPSGVSALSQSSCNPTILAMTEPPSEYRPPRTAMASQSVSQLHPSAPMESNSPHLRNRSNSSSAMAQSVPNLPPSAPIAEEIGFSPSPMTDILGMQSTMSLPEVIATPVPLHSSDTSVTYVDSDVHFVLGGDAILLPEENPDTGEFLNEIPLTRPLPPAYAPSLAILYEEMLTSVNDFEILERKVWDDGWKSLLQSISADEFGTIIGHVNMDFDQPRVAVLLVPLLNGGDNFTCAYCAAAVRSTAEWNRSSMVEHLVSFVVDLATNKHLILAELSHWDQIITEECITESLSRRGMW